MHKRRHGSIGGPRWGIGGPMHKRRHGSIGGPMVEQAAVATGAVKCRVEAPSTAITTVICATVSRMRVGEAVVAVSARAMPIMSIRRATRATEAAVGSTNRASRDTYIRWRYVARDPPLHCFSAARAAFKTHGCALAMRGDECTQRRVCARAVASLEHQAVIPIHAHRSTLRVAILSHQAASSKSRVAAAPYVLTAEQVLCTVRAQAISSPLHR